MPHATGDMMDEEEDVASAVQQFLGNSDAPFNPDQSTKADDAIDYEDFSDDELPDEEEPTNMSGGDDEDLSAYYGNAPPAIGGLPVPAATNGHGQGHEDVDAKAVVNNDLFGEGDGDSDMFGDADGINDLFGESGEGSGPYSSPEEARRQQPQQPRLGGLALALPSKSGLALPSSFSQSRVPMQQSPSSLSPPHFPDDQDDYSAMSPTSMTSDDDDEGLDPETALQRRLFKDSRRRNAGEDVVAGPVNTDMTLFHTLYPGYEQTHIPKFIELFPGYNVDYKGKLPVKPPKAVQPHKLTLDLLQDQERSFRSITAAGKAGQDSTFNNSFITFGYGNMTKDDSDDEQESSAFDEDERIGGISMQDLALICQDWDAASIDAISTVEELAEHAMSRRDSDHDWDADDDERPVKKRKAEGSCLDILTSYHDSNLSFEDPERAVAKLAKAVTLDLNDPNLLIDEHAPRTQRKLKRMPGDIKRDAALSRDIAKRYNISNDQAYDLLKENHQHKVRSTLGSMAIEHSSPATKLQYPFYQVSLDNKAKRNFHRPQLELKTASGKEFRFQKPKHVKRKNVRGKDAKEVFAKAEDLSLGDSASLLMLEYSEEAPMMLSNFGMGNRLINYYRKKDAEDSTRPKLDIGEAQVLLTQDKSPFANFGHVDKGDTVPTIQNGLFRAPIFSHDSKPVDFVIGISSTYEGGDRFYLRNVENLHTVGQQFPLAEVPGQHSRKVTDAAKKRLRALAYRIYMKSRTRRDKVLDNRTLMPHLPGHDMPQTRSKMREFMKYERVTNKGENGGGVWIPTAQNPVPDLDTLRSWIKPEDVCLLDSMQVGVQHLADLGITETKDAEEQDADEASNNIEVQLIPWRATKNFLNACQGKAMLTLHGEGDPTNRGEGFSFVKTSMKGGFQAPGESVNDKLNTKNKKDTGGHSYNVAKQQKAYDDYIRRIWEAQKDSLANTQEFSDDDMEDARDGDGEYAYSRSRAQTPRSSFGGPAGMVNRHDDDVSQFSGHSQGDKSLVITRKGGLDENGNPRADTKDVIYNPAVIKEYRKRQLAKQLSNASMDTYKPTGNSEQDAARKQALEKELMRIKRNAERREARERLKAKGNASPAAAGSPGPSEVDGPSSNPNATADNTPQKGKGRSKDGTQRKCANCGLVGHIKTNRKLCPKLNGTQSAEDGGANGDSSFGAAPAPLAL